MNKPREFWINKEPKAIASTGIGYVAVEHGPETPDAIHCREVLPIPQSVEAEIERASKFDEPLICSEKYIKECEASFRLGAKFGYELAMRTMKNEA
jgi:hypothetical protein